MERFWTVSKFSPPPCGKVEIAQRFRVGGTAERAKRLRKKTTIAERILWSALRQLKPTVLHFRKQAPLGRYVLDFVCHGAKLIVEVDGSQHGTSEGIQQDATRTAFLNSQGYRVIRFWNVDVITNSHGISDAIFRIAKSLDQSGSTSVPPPPCGEVEIAQRFRVGELRCATPTRLARCNAQLPDVLARRPPHKGEVEDEASP
jgi:very-short-patch-repair endonuclease